LKTKIRNIILFSLLVIAIPFFTGCEGPEGAAGPQGLPGTDGNANIIYSGWQELEEEIWSGSINFFSQLRREYVIHEPAINENILSRGTVLVYMRNISADADDLSDTVFTLPTILHITKPTSQYLGVDLKTEIIKIIFHDLDGGEDPGLIPSNLFEYRYIIIPSGSALSNVMLSDVIEYVSLLEFDGIVP
jgi:hypothetical protein